MFTAEAPAALFCHVSYIDARLSLKRGRRRPRGERKGGRRDGHRSANANRAVHGDRISTVLDIDRSSARAVIHRDIANVYSWLGL